MEIFLLEARWGLEISARCRRMNWMRIIKEEKTAFRSQLLVMISGCVRELRSGSIVAVFHPPHSSRCFKSAENFFQQSIWEFASLGVGQDGRESADVQRHSSWMEKCFMHFYRLLTKILVCKRKVLRNEKFRLYFFAEADLPAYAVLLSFSSRIHHFRAA